MPVHEHEHEPQTGHHGRAAQNQPRYRLLVLSERRARLFEGSPLRLHEVAGGGFPVPARAAPDRRDRSRRFGRERSDRRDAALRTQMRAIDSALAARRTRQPLPLVIAGVPRQLALFQEMSSEASSVVGEIRGSHERTAIGRLAHLTRPIIHRHRRAERRAALARLSGGRDQVQIVEGIDDVWAAAVDGRIRILCVEEGFNVPESDALPVVADHTIDELVGLVRAAGGETILVEDGTLATRQHVAALCHEDRDSSRR